MSCWNLLLVVMAMNILQWKAFSATSKRSRLDALVRHNERAQQIIARWSSFNTTKLLQDEMCKLTLKEMGFHFSARTMTEMKLKDFNIQAMSNKIQNLAPGICGLFDVQKERVLPAPVGAQPTTSFPSYMARAVLTWYQHGRFPNFFSVMLRILLIVQPWVGGVDVDAFAFISRLFLRRECTF